MHCGIISIGSLLIASLVLCRVMRPEKLVVGIVSLFLFLTAQIVIIGFILSALGLLSSEFYWAVFSGAALAMTLGAVASSKKLRYSAFARIAISNSLLSFKNWYRGLPRFEKTILALLVLTVLIINILNLTIVVFTAPHTWDGMAFKLARVAYFLQWNSIGHYDADYINQVVVQKNAELLMLYAFVVSGYNENTTQLIQFIAYWVAIVIVYGIARECGIGRSASLFSALIFALLTECIMQSTTVQNDILLTAYVGSIAFSLFAFRNSRERKYLFMAGMGIGLGLGVKASILVVFPALFVIAVYVMFLERGDTFAAKAKNSVFFLVISFFAISIFAIPAGYLENYSTFGHPIGPESFRKDHSIEGSSLGQFIANGTKDLLKYSLDFLALDGLPRIEPVERIQAWIRWVPRNIIVKTGIDLEAESDIEWRYDIAPCSHEDYSSWGIFGFALLLPAVVLLLLGVIKSSDGRVLAIAFILTVISHAYSGDYPISGKRWATYGFILASPLAAYLFVIKNKVFKIYLMLIIGLGCLSGLTSVLFRYRSPILTRQSVFLQDRLSQILRGGPIFQEPIRSFEEIVPAGAVVATYINENSYEYPLFGYKLTRTIIPLNSFWRGLQPVPENADYLLWADDFDEVLNRNEADIHLGKDWYLRKLK